MAEPGHVVDANSVIAELENYIQATALRYRFVPGYDPEDAAQEGRIAVWRAIHFYDGRVPFATYARACARNGILTLINLLNRKKRLLTCGISVSLDEQTEKGATDHLTDGLPGPEEAAVGNELAYLLKKAAQERLTLVERAVFAMSVSGYTRREVAGMLEINEKSADNALQRARRKLKEYCRKEWFNCG